MVPSPGNYYSKCVSWRKPDMVWKDPRSWLEKFSSVIMSFNFCYSDHDSSLFLMTNSNGPILICLYVDDMIIICDKVDGIDEMKLYLAKKNRWQVYTLFSISWGLRLQTPLKVP